MVLMLTDLEEIKINDGNLRLCDHCFRHGLISSAEGRANDTIIALLAR